MGTAARRQQSVKKGDRVAVLDKLEDGWWLVDKSNGGGKGPYGLIPGNRCCWTLHDDELPAPPGGLTGG